MVAVYNTHPPDGTRFLREHIKIFHGHLNGRQLLYSEVGPAVHKLYGTLEHIEGQPVVTVVRQVGHVNVKLKHKSRWYYWHEKT